MLVRSHGHPEVSTATVHGPDDIGRIFPIFFCHPCSLCASPPGRVSFLSPSFSGIIVWIHQNYANKMKLKKIRHHTQAPNLPCHLRRICLPLLFSTKSNSNFGMCPLFRYLCGNSTRFLFNCGTSTRYNKKVGTRLKRERVSCLVILTFSFFSRTRHWFERL